MSFPSEAPFVDRETSLAKLHEISRRADGFCFLLVGRQGIGKSRLLRRFAAEASAGPAASAICVFHETYRTGGSLQEFARLELEIVAHPAVHALLESQHDPGWAPCLNRWLRDTVAALDPTAGKALAQLPVERLIREVVWSRTVLDEYEIVENFLQTLRYVAKNLAEEQRLVIIMDPGAFLDEGSMDLRKVRILYDVVRNLPSRAILIVALRDTDPAAHETEFLILPNVELYREMEPFAVEDIFLLLKAVFGADLSFEVAYRVHRRYGGDPFATEMAIRCATREAVPARALVDRSPEKLLELMGVYHDGFAAPLQRRLLRALAIPEEPSPLGLVSVLLDGGADREHILRLLRMPEMSGAVVALPPGDGREPRFRIYHETFAEFLRERAREYGESDELNRRAGKYYSEVGQPALALFHFSLARDSEGIRKNLERGLEWYRIQGETLRMLRMNEILSRQQLSARERFLLGKAVAWAYSLAGESDEVLSSVEDLLAVTEENSVEAAELLLLRGDCYHNSSRYAESYSDFQAAKAIMEKLGETESLLYRQILLEAAHMLTHLGDFRASEVLHDRLVSTQRFPVNSRIEVLVQGAREIRRYGELLVFTGEWDEAERLLQLARREFAHLGHRRGEGDALRRIADLHLLRGGSDEYLKALQTARRAYELLAEVGSRGASFMGMVIGEAQRGLGRFEEARLILRQCVEEYEKDESPHLVSMAEIGLAECERLALGEPRMDLYGRALSRYEAINSDWGIATTLFYRGIGHLSAKDQNAGSADLERARRIFSQLGLPPSLKAILEVLEKGNLGFFPLIVL